MEDAGGSAVAPAKEKKNTNELFPLRVSRKPSFPLTLSPHLATVDQILEPT